jgi:hypothetical protein
MKKALFLAAFDSQLKWCGQIQNEFARRGFATQVMVPDVRSALSAAQIRDAGFDDVQKASWEELLRLAMGSDVVVCGLSGPATRTFCFALADRQAAAAEHTQPVLISGWVGVIIEKIIAGYLDRCGSDLVAVNSGLDLALFRDAAQRLSLPDGNLLLTGLPFLSSSPSPIRSNPIRRVLFADQPTVPASRRERQFLYQQLLRYAERHPDREVLLKPRHRPGEDTFHRMRHHPEDLLLGHATPANFRIDYTPISQILPCVDLLLTMSSTACLEALDVGCRVGLVLDLGIHERYGNHVFLDSGLLRTFSELESDEIGTPDPQWFSSFFFDRAGPAAKLIADRTEELLSTGHRPSREVWASAYFNSAASAHRELGNGLARSAPASWAKRYSLALRRRQQRHGPVRGTLAHLSSELMPPLLYRTFRKVARRIG